jgi:hypothetical protein
MGWWAMSKQIIPNVMYHHQTTELYRLLSMKIKELGKGKQTAIS